LHSEKLHDESVNGRVTMTRESIAYILTNHGTKYNPNPNHNPNPK